MPLHFRRPWLSAAAAVIFAVCCIQNSRLEVPQERGFLPIDPATPFVRYRMTPDTAGTILLVHGLSSSKEFMEIFASALAEGGFEVYAIDLPGHGGSTAGFNAVTAQIAVSRAVDYLGGDVTVIGHSLGAGLLLDLATQQPFGTMVLLSPPPTPVSKIRARRLLVVTGDWDMPRINAFIPEIREAATTPVEWRRLPWVGHSTAVFSPAHTADIVRWLGGTTVGVRTIPRLLWIVLQLISSLLLGISLLRGTAIIPRSHSIRNSLLLYIAAGAVTVAVLRFMVVMSWLRLFATDYLISFLLVNGLLIWLFNAMATPSGAQPVVSHIDKTGRVRGWMTALLAAAFVILVMGWLGGSHFFHFSLSGGRWWRFPVIAAASFPLFANDELRLRPVYPRWKAAGAGILARLLLGGLIVTGALIFSQQAAFLVLIIHLVILFWIGLWFATELVHQQTQNAGAAALFAALVQGWAFAAVFVTT